MASGANVSDDIPKVYKEIKDKSAHKFATFMFKDKTYSDIVVDKIGAEDATYEDFCAALMGDGPPHCRYGVMDYTFYVEQRNVTKNKLLFFTWAPDDAPIRDKMVYASSKTALKKAFETGISKDIHAADVGELSETRIKELMIKMDKD